MPAQVVTVLTPDPEISYTIACELPFKLEADVSEGVLTIATVREVECVNAHAPLIGMMAGVQPEQTGHTHPYTVARSIFAPDHWTYVKMDEQG